jgi:hypothetical protein
MPLGLLPQRGQVLRYRTLQHRFHLKQELQDSAVGLNVHQHVKIWKSSAALTRDLPDTLYRWQCLKSLKSRMDDPVVFQMTTSRISVIDKLP